MFKIVGNFQSNQINLLSFHTDSITSVIELITPV